MEFEKITNILKEQVKPALGCTEPVAVAIAVSRAYREIGGNVESIFVNLSPNIFKNGMRVGIPGTEERGIPFAVALAVKCGNPDLGLEVFRDVSEENIECAKQLLNENKIEMRVEDSKAQFYIETGIKTDKGSAKCIIQGYHTNITYVEVNSRVVFEKVYEADTSKKNINKIGDLTIRELREIVEKIPYKDIEFLLEGRKLNLSIAMKGLNDRTGLALGAGIEELVKKGVIQRDIVNQVRILTAAATDARMSGINMPVMSSAGSGNHGITAIIPPSMVCEELGFDDEKLARALALSHLVTIYIKEFTGRLSPVCGCSIAAGIGACASVAWLIGCSDEQIAGAIKNMIGNLAGMVCDGAKGGCAFKLSTASSEAIISAQLAKNNIIISDFDGIVGDEVETTIRNLGKFCMEGMADTDKKIIEIILTQ